MLSHMHCCLTQYRELGPYSWMGFCILFNSPGCGCAYSFQGLRRLQPMESFQDMAKSQNACRILIFNCFWLYFQITVYQSVCCLQTLAGYIGILLISWCRVAKYVILKDDPARSSQLWGRKSSRTSREVVIVCEDLSDWASEYSFSKFCNTRWLCRSLRVICSVFFCLRLQTQLGPVNNWSSCPSTASVRPYFVGNETNGLWEKHFHQNK
jgi:hypothetical protein